MTFDPVGMREIAERLGVKQNTVSQWRQRSQHGDYKVPMPEPRWKVSGFAAWDWSEIQEWARLTRRLPHPPSGGPSAPDAPIATAPIEPIPVVADRGWGTLIDSDTNEVIGAATEEQAEASADAVDGAIMIDEDGDVVPEDLHATYSGPLRTVYVD